MYEINSTDLDDFLQFEEIEEEESVYDPNEVQSPFDPKDIKIIVEPKTIDHLVQRLIYNEIDLNTEFQRKGNLWKPDAQSRLIESILLRFPLPAFYFDAEDESNWLVVDGLQRLWTIKNFVVDSLAQSKNSPLKLTGLDILVDYNGQSITYSDLTRGMQRRILETPITTYLIQPGTPKDVKYNIFRRINTGGLGLNSMEIRNALNQGRAANFLKELSEDVELRSMLKIQDKRMEDRELYLRAISFMIRDYKQYTTPLSGFLDKSMERLASISSSDLKIIKEKIKTSIKIQLDLFNKNIFSRSVDSKNKLKLNSALFEVWVSEVSKLTAEEQEKLITNKDILIDKYIDLIRDDSFSRAISTSTSGYSAVTLRFNRVNQIIRDII